MKRTRKKTKITSAILVGDLHLREDQPTCRTDDFLEVQDRKLTWLRSLQEEHQCPVYCAGDVFQHWKASPFLISFALSALPDNFHTVYGNHDLPAHSWDLRQKSALQTLELAGKANILKEAHWEQPVDQGSMFYPGSDRTILVWHVMTYQNQTPWPGCPDLSAKEILKKYPQFDLILTGHNHQCFIEEYQGRLLVNPGSLTRQTADQDGHEPGVFLWDSNTNTVQKAVPPYANNVISREHIVQAEEREARYAAFIARLNQEGDPELSFEKNLEKYFQQNSVVKSVRELIYKHLEA